MSKKRGPKTAAGRARATKAYVKQMKKGYVKLRNALDKNGALTANGFLKG